MEELMRKNKNVKWKNVDVIINKHEMTKAWHYTHWLMCEAKEEGGGDCVVVMSGEEG